MDAIRVGVWQFEPAAGQPQENLDALGRALDSRAAQDLDVLVAPEMFLTGWEPRIFRDRASVDPSLVTKVGHHAKRRKVSIAASLLTADRAGLRNTFHLWSASGKLVGAGHKIHLWAKEAEHLEPGEEAAPIEAPYARVGGIVCYDVEFPEVARAHALAGAELFLVPAAFYTPHTWDLMTRARALENGCFLAAANQIGGDPKNPHNGQSRIVDPFGNVLAEVPAKTSGIASASLDPSRIAAARAWAPFLRDLRLGPRRLRAVHP
jgi:5-aminopentanamidase